MASIGSVNTNPYMPTGLGQTTGEQTPPGSVGQSTSTKSTAPVGGGTVSQTNAVPGTKDTTTAMQSFMLTAIMESMHQFMPEISGDEQDIILAEVQAKMKDVVGKTDNEEVKNKSESREKQLEERKKKLEDAEKKLEDMIKLQNSGDIFDKIKLAFEILGALLLTALVTIGTLGAGTGVGLAIGIALIVGAVAGDVMAVNDVVKKETGLGIAGNIDKAIHPHDPDSWAKADQGFEFALMGLAAVGMIVGLATGTGEEQFAQALPKLIEHAADLERATDFVNIAATVGTVVGDVGSAATSYQTTEIQAQSKKDQARAKEMLAMMKHLDEMIDLAIKRLQSDGDRWAKMLDSVTEAMQDRSETVGKAKLTA